jgi:hypothetical protein
LDIEGNDRRLVYVQYPVICQDWINERRELQQQLTLRRGLNQVPQQESENSPLEAACHLMSVFRTGVD